MKFKAVIFDLDGVLIDSEIVNLESAARGFRDFGYEISQADRALIVGRHPSDYVLMLKNRMGFREEIVEPLRKKIDEEYSLRLEKFIKLLPEVKDTIKTLKEKKVSLSIATASTWKSVQVFLKKFDFENTFDYFTTVEDVKKRKPDPEIYLTAKGKLNLPDEEILVVEDTEIGIQAAKAAGLTCVAVPNEFTKEHNFREADYVFKTVKELLTLFE